MPTRTLAITKTAIRAKHPDQTYPRVAGETDALIIGRNNGFIYSAGFKAAIDATDWDDVREVTAATLVLRTPPSPASFFGWALVSGRMLLTRLVTRDFPDNTDHDFDGGAYQEADRNYAKATTSFPTIVTPSISKSGNSVHNINVIKFLRAWAPTGVRFRIGGDTYKGLAKANHGFVAERMDSTQAVIASENYPDVDLQPVIIFEYTAKPSASTVFVTGPTSPILQAEEQFFEGDLVATKAGEKLQRVHIQVYKATVDTGDYNDAGSLALWNKVRDARSTEVDLGSFSTPLTDVVSASLKSLMPSGAYKWRVRLQTASGWTAWSAAQTLNVDATAPTLSLLRPSAGDYDDLNGVVFSARVTNTNLVRNAQNVATSVRRLLSYRVQVMEDTPPGDPAWDTGPFLWDTSDRPATQSDRALTLIGSPVTSGHSTFSTLYGGQTLEPGDYSYRMKATDELGAESDWEYGTFSILVGEQPDPGETEFLTGYSKRKTKARIVIKGITHNTQRIKVKATGGNWKLAFSGDETGNLAHNISAASLKTEIEALSGVDALDSVTVDTSVAGQRTYTVVFRAAGQMAEANTPLFVLTDVSLAGAGHALTLTSGSNRAPNRQVAVIYDAANIGASEFWNSPGEFFFTLPATHPQVSVIEPYQVHYSLQHYQGEGWTEKAAGLIVDFDASDEDIVFYGTDYLGALAGGVDERLTDNPDAQAKLYPATGGGSKYVDRTVTQIVTDQLDRAIHHANSPVGFISRGSIAAMAEEVTIFSTFKPRLDFIAGLIDTHRGANPGNKTRLRVRKTAAGGYQFRVEDNPGKDRDNLGIQYGRLVQGFRVIGFGQFSTRTLAIGFPVEGSEPIYLKDITGGVDENLYGRWPSPRLWQDIDGKADLQRRAKLDARQKAKVGKRIAIGFRVDALGVKDGWDICDSLLIDIRRGAVDTSRYGSSYWTVWGWAWRLYPDGHSDLTLSILPREDTATPDADLIPAKPINVTKEWDVQQLAGLAPASFDVISSEIERDDGSIETFVNVAETGVPALRVLDSDTGKVWVPEADVDGSLTGAYVEEQEITAASALESDHALLADVATIANDIIDGVLDQANFISTLRVPIIHTGALPALPNASYPNGQLLYRTDDSVLYKNENGTWEAAAMTSDIVAGTIIAGAVAAGAVATALITLKMNPQDAGSGFQNHATVPSVTITPSGIVIENGAIVLKDQFGATAMLASGFSGSWMDFIATGLYNGAFRAGTAGSVANGRTSALPYWTVADANAGGTLTFLNPGIKFTWGATSDEKTVQSDAVPILPGQSYEVAVAYEVNRAAGTITLGVETEIFEETLTFSTTLLQIDAAHTATRSFFVKKFRFTAGDSDFFVKIKLKGKETTAHSASNSLTVHSVRLTPVSGPGTDVLVITTAASPFTFDKTNFDGNLSEVEVWSVGGGGAGGSCQATGGTESSAGGGGGGGGVAYKKFSANELPDTCTVTIGAGGTAGAAGNNDGNDGGNTTFAGTGITTVQGSGGVGGNGSAANTGPERNVGGAGGSSSGGDYNLAGSAGQTGVVTRGDGGQGDPTPAVGGASAGFGGGGSPSAASGNGGTGRLYGGGGAGGWNANSQASGRTGGAGAAGVCIIKLHYF